jgi:hypothetical protein
MKKIVLITYIILISLVLTSAKGVKTTIKTVVQECGNKSFKNTEVSVFYKYPDKIDSFDYYYDTSGRLFKYSSISNNYDKNGKIISRTHYGYSNKDSIALDSLSYIYFKDFRIIKHYILNVTMKIERLDTIYINKLGFDSLLTYTYFGVNLGVDSMIKNGIQYYYTSNNLDSTYRIKIYKNFGLIQNASYINLRNKNYKDSQLFYNYTENNKVWLTEKYIRNANFTNVHYWLGYSTKSYYIDSTILNKDSAISKYILLRYDESYGKFLPFTTFKYIYNSNKILSKVLRYDYSGLANATPTCPTISIQTYTYDSVDYITSMVASPMEENKLAIYPNPVGTDRIIYLTNYINSGIVQVYGLDGKLIYSTSIKSSNKVELSLEIPKGMYLMRVQDNAGRSGCSKVMVE